MLYDYTKLKARILEKYGTMSAFAKELGIDSRHVSALVNNRRGFTRTRILDWCKKLDISEDEIPMYFFALLS